MRGSLSWRIERASGSATDFHEREVLEPAARTVWVFSVERPAVVLGSTQSLDTVVAGAAIEVVRRRSGGGAVLLVPGESLWVDVVVPRADPLWDDDVGRAAHWLGHVWADALGDCGLGGVSVRTGVMVRTPWSGLVCFAGLGPGEVQVDGRKAIGISQRRTRAGARFQCVVHRRWRPERLLALLREAPPVAELDPVAEIDAVPEPLLTSFLARLP